MCFKLKDWKLFTQEPSDGTIYITPLLVWYPSIYAEYPKTGIYTHRHYRSLGMY